MEEEIETRVSPGLVWKAWEKAHALQGEKGIEEGKKGKNKFRYEILEVKKGESFSILWKTLFVRLLFTHTVKRARQGSSICYQVRIKGLFAWPVRWLLGAKIQRSLSVVLKAMVRQLENEGIE